MYTHLGYTIVPSKKTNKKYDVYKKGIYITSFGDVRYQQFKDKLGYYSHLDHFDENRRKAYRKRHANDYINDPMYAGYWSWKFLW